MFHIAGISLPDISGRQLLSWRAEREKLLACSLSPAQRAHVGRFMHPRMRALRILTRLATLEHINFTSPLDMDSHGRSFFPFMPHVTISFSYSANCAIYALGFAPLGHNRPILAVDMEPVATCRQSGAMADFLNKIINPAGDAPLDRHLPPKMILKCWLFYECAIKMFPPERATAIFAQAMHKLSAFANDAVHLKPLALQILYYNMHGHIICLAMQSHLSFYGQPAWTIPGPGDLMEQYANFLTPPSC